MESYPTRWQVLIPSPISSPPMPCLWNSGKTANGASEIVSFSSPFPDLITTGKKRI